jgi:hypothetical protein
VSTEGLRPSRKLRYFRSPSLKNIHGKKNEMVQPQLKKETRNAASYPSIQQGDA